MSTEMLARQLVAVLDRRADPADRGNERVEVIAEALGSFRWRALTLAAVMRHSLAALEASKARRDWLDIELAWLLSGDR